MALPLPSGPSTKIPVLVRDAETGSVGMYCFPANATAFNVLADTMNGSIGIKHFGKAYIIPSPSTVPIMTFVEENIDPEFIVFREKGVSGPLTLNRNGTVTGRQRAPKE